MTRGAVALCALLLAAPSGLAKDRRWYTQPGTPVTVESSGFMVRTTLPHGWTFTDERGFVPPPALASDCRVRSAFHTDSNWDRFLVSILESTAGLSTARDARAVVKIGGHPAVSNRYVREGTVVHDYYINLSELQPGSFAVWTFEGSTTAEAGDCEMQFMTLVHRGRITR
jgi:hypothetical protein